MSAWCKPSAPWVCGTSAAAFLVPGLALWLPSGYSWGAVALLLLALCHPWRSSREISVFPVPLAAKALMAAFAAMGLLWSIDALQMQELSRMERVLKHLLVLPCLVLVARCPPQAGALWWGVVLGGCGSGLVALWQIHGLHLERANGFTNAIQYGNLSLLFAIWAFIGWWCVPHVRMGALALTRLLAVAAVVLGILGSLLSQSRGGWVAAVVGVPFLVALAWRYAPSLSSQRRLWVGILSALGLSALLAAAAQTQIVAERWDSARAEVQHYYSTGDARTSVGQRLDHWQLAWDMGWDRPVLGWGMKGYAEEKTRRVAAGQADPFVLEFDHAHNEWFDMFAKKGLIGVAVLALFYAVPLAVFWPTRRRLQGRPASVLPWRLMGVALPLLYLGFGTTQVFFAHNSGFLFYLFMACLLWGVLHGLEQRAATPAG